MPSVSTDLYSSLFKWAHNNGENFLTDAFVFLVRELLHREPALARRFIGWLCFDDEHTPLLSGALPTIGTWMHAAEGIPDIHIDAPGLLVLVEVKKGSDLHSGQLSQYHSMLDRRKQSTKRLVLLTAFAANFIEEEKPDRWVRWGEVANWINQRLPKDLVAHYLTTQFLAFLRSQVMAIEKVEWQYIEGTKALYNFTTMLGQALQNSGVPIYRVSGTWDSRGHYIASGGQFWTGINMDKPHLLRFQFETAKPDLELLKQHGWQFQDGKYVTTLDLSSESIHFFARSQDSQLDCLTDFVRNAFQVGTRCTKPQPAQQEEPASDTATLQ